MKKGALVLAVLFVTAILCSCSSHRGCEAYSKVDVEKKEVRG